MKWTVNYSALSALKHFPRKWKKTLFSPFNVSSASPIPYHSPLARHFLNPLSLFLNPLFVFQFLATEYPLFLHLQYVGQLITFIIHFSFVETNGRAEWMRFNATSKINR